MTTDRLIASVTVPAPAEAVFAVLTDPAAHGAIDGTGWVREPLDPKPLTEAGQIFRMAMHHNQHPDGDYVTANRVGDFEPPTVISWQTGYDPANDGNLRFGGWFWRYELAPVADSATEVTLVYDWSAAPPEVRERIQFPPFPPAHLDRSLDHLAKLVAERAS